MAKKLRAKNRARTAPERGGVQSVKVAARILKALAFAGGVGWANSGTAAPSEGGIARAAVAQDYGLTLRWVDDQSRDTAENAANLHALLARDGVQRIALVTQAWHMPRAQQAFERAGFTVTPAPTGFTLPQQRNLLEWLPTAHGLQSSREVLREWLGLRVAKS